jgi:hypothetical protein
MRERAKLRDLERLNAAQAALCRHAEARLAEALNDERKRRNAHETANSAFEESLEDCRRAMSGSKLDPDLLVMFARTPPLMARKLSQAATALSAAEDAAERERVRHAHASVAARTAERFERKSRRRLARKLEERSIGVYEDLFALKGTTP